MKLVDKLKSLVHIKRNGPFVFYSEVPMASRNRGKSCGPMPGLKRKHH